MTAIAYAARAGVSSTVIQLSTFIATFIDGTPRVRRSAGSTVG